MPLFLLRNYAWGYIYARLFVYRKDGAIKDTLLFLIIKKAETFASDNEDNAKDEDVEENTKDDKLPFQTQVGQLRISEDITANTRVMKQFLCSHHTQNPHNVGALLVKRHMLA